MSPDVPRLFEKLQAGDEAALGELTNALYGELRRIAGRFLKRERSGHTLQPTALVHEAYLKLFDAGGRQFSNKAHFLAVAARVMRQVLVDYARARSTQKRRGGERVDWTVSLEAGEEKGVDQMDLIALDEALEALVAEDEPLARMVELKYFGGLTAEEIAETQGLTVNVVRHDLRLAQAWLRRRLSEGKQGI
jgi:RNA polymerase sigma factor (TIGR02999 family)